MQEIDPWTNVETRPILEPKRPRRTRDAFVEIGMRDLKKASALAGRTPLLLLLLARYRADTQGAGGTYPITLPSSLMSEWGICASSKSEGLKALERVGLLKVLKRPGETAHLKLPKSRFGSRFHGQDGSDPKPRAKLLRSRAAR
jgi:hypothetical protein